jgi:hypothetical protein
MGAIEYLATQIKEGSSEVSSALESLAGAAKRIASAIEELATATKDGNSEIADAIEDAAAKLTQKDEQHA